ncbi:uncharacterized protein LOC122973263 isoform X2 [Scomber scombrus]|uniref:Uncharacterized protein LOC122973263 isoform X2 n=1 Tax=Scomber scombrus TaxID=13677 RepID=A0AAV1PM48_SCOSC
MMENTVFTGSKTLKNLIHLLHFIYTQGGGIDQCELNTNTHTNTCVYNLPMKSLNLSHAGTYYCAVASCGQIVFGKGTTLEFKHEKSCLGVYLEWSFGIHHHPGCLLGLHSIYNVEDKQLPLHRFTIKIISCLGSKWRGLPRRR